MILGLDISTTCAGYALLDGDMLYESGFWRLDKSVFKVEGSYCLYLRADFVRSCLRDITVPVTAIFIEAPAKGFRPGKSNIDTLMLCAAFNKLVSYFCYDVFKVRPQYLYPTSIRKLLGLRIEHGEDAKIRVLEYVTRKFPSFVVKYGKTGEVQKYTLDESDAVAVALAGKISCER